MIIIGWLSVSLSLLSLAPSFLPGAMSIIGLLLSLTALILATATVSSNGTRFYIPTLLITLFGLFFVNDALRVWDTLDIGAGVKTTLYILCVVVVLCCSYIALRYRDRS